MGLQRWVALGAPDPRDGVPDGEVAAVEEDDEIDLEAGRRCWAFQAPIMPKVPLAADLNEALSPLDAFIRAKAEAADLPLAKRADERLLIRRAAFDLTGLPPTPEDFDESYERLLDRWLASPRYGERWGRHWLDVARYSDSNGMDENKAHTSAFRYRDYVIESFNEDLPFDVFAKEQVAGDLLDTTQPSAKIATGFLAVGPKMLACDDQVKK